MNNLKEVVDEVVKKYFELGSVEKAIASVNVNIDTSQLQDMVYAWELKNRKLKMEQIRESKGWLYRQVVIEEAI